MEAGGSAKQLLAYVSYLSIEAIGLCLEVVPA